MKKDEYSVDLKQVTEFKFCPYCGSSAVGLYLGDYWGWTECLECDKELEMTYIEETDRK